jgi:predicted dehydrogenase
MKIGVIGYGYWGPNIVRNFNSIEEARVVSVCDRDPAALTRAQKTNPDLQIVKDSNDIVNSPDVDAVAIVTPVSSHFELARKALENGKHVFVEKPFTATSREAEELIEIADKKGLTLMVDHTFIFTGAVRKIKELLDNQMLGDLYYYDSTRVNLGLFQHDVNVIWDLAPHDLSIMDFVLGKKPVAVAATGAEHFGSGLENIAYITVCFDNSMIAHFNVNWLSPVKIRTTLIGGSKKMLVWNDLEEDEKIKVYDRGVNIDNTTEGVRELLVDYRSGDMWSPKVERKEALKAEVEYFIECVRNNKIPVNDGRAGLRVVKLLEAANESLRNRGKMVKV